MNAMLCPREVVLLKRRRDGTYFKTKQEWVAEPDAARQFANQPEAELFCIIANVGEVDLEAHEDNSWGT